MTQAPVQQKMATPSTGATVAVPQQHENEPSVRTCKSFNLFLLSEFYYLELP